MEQQERLTRVRDADVRARTTISPHYDEVITELCARAEATGSLGKVDLGALVAWKRLRADTLYMGRLMATAETTVREHTAAAFAAARNPDLSTVDAATAARRALEPLPGFRSGDALASAACFICAPDRLAVYDRRAHAGLRVLGLDLTRTGGVYGQYMAHLDALRAALDTPSDHWTARRVDLALYVLGKGDLP